MSEQIDWSKAPEGATHYVPAPNDLHHPIWLKMDGNTVLNAGYIGHSHWAHSYTPGSQPCTDLSNAIQRPTTPSWSGEGLPPVGVVCEVRQKTPHSSAFDWEKCTICLTNIGANGCVQVCTIDHRGDFAIYYPEIDIVEFRPIRTPEQIAADERDKAIRAIVYDLQDAENLISLPSIASCLYGKGYRKQEKPE